METERQRGAIPRRMVAALVICQLMLTAPTAIVGQRSSARNYTIAFASFAPVGPTLFIAGADGGGARPLLANPDVDYNPSFSRDGAWIVFTSHRGGSADVFRVRANGSGVERLTDHPSFDDQGALSPDGRFLAFVSTRSGSANIWLLELASRALKHLTPGSTGDFRPAWSPDGEWIAFSSGRESRAVQINIGALHVTQIYVMRRDGSDVRRISATLGTAGSPTWSPDGSRVAYYQTAVTEIPKILAPQGSVDLLFPPSARGPANMQIVSVDWRTGETQIVREGRGEKYAPQWLSIDRLAYVSGGPSGGIERTDAAGARGEFWSPTWSPDGRVMVFHREAGAIWPPFQPWHTRDARFPLLRTGIFPSYSPSGTQLVLNSAAAGILHNAILIMNADGSNRRVLFEDPNKSALAPAWSPMGDRIAFGLGEFFSMVPGREAVTSQLALINVDGTGLRVLAAAGMRTGFPSWSPDGKRLVYRAGGNAGRGLRIIDVATERVIELTDGSHSDNFPAWSPRGDHIAFTTDRDGDYEIYSIRPDGTDLRRLTRSPGNDSHMAWSPDGRFIAFGSARTGFADELLLHPGNAQPNGEIFVMRADGSDVRRLTDNQFEDATPTWKPSR